MKYKCAICGWTGSEDELNHDYRLDSDGGEEWCDTVCPECDSWSVEKIEEDDEKSHP